MRAKYPGAYDDLSDWQLEQKVVAKYPEYKDLAESAPKIAPSTISDPVASLEVMGGMPLPPFGAALAAGAGALRSGVQRLAGSRGLGLAADVAQELPGVGGLIKAARVAGRLVTKARDAGSSTRVVSPAAKAATEGLSKLPTNLVLTPEQAAQETAWRAILQQEASKRGLGYAAGAQ